jgi:hypothetical protein
MILRIIMARNEVRRSTNVVVNDRALIAAYVVEYLFFIAIVLAFHFVKTATTKKNTASVYIRPL